MSNTYYLQISVVRTIEQILGAQPLNEEVAAAAAMYVAFTARPNYTPFNAVPNQVPLTEGIFTRPARGSRFTTQPAMYRIPFGGSTARSIC